MPPPLKENGRERRERRIEIFRNLQFESGHARARSRSPISLCRRSAFGRHELPLPRFLLLHSAFRIDTHSRFPPHSLTITLRRPTAPSVLPSFLPSSCFCVCGQIIRIPDCRRNFSIGIGRATERGVLYIRFDSRRRRENHRESRQSVRG